MPTPRFSYAAFRNAQSMRAYLIDTATLNRETFIIWLLKEAKAQNVPISEEIKAVISIWITNPKKTKEDYEAEDSANAEIKAKMAEEESKAMAEDEAKAKDQYEEERHEADRNADGY